MSISTTADVDMAQCERIGRECGLAAGLALALSGIEVAEAAPGRYAAVPAEAVALDAPVLRHRLAELEGIALLECPGGCPAGDGAALAEVGRRLAAVRLGVLRAVLDQAVEHLSDRVSGGEPLVRKQLITGAIADVVCGIEMVRTYAEALSEPAALGDVHSQIDALGWEVAKLYGAAGYLADGPGRALYVSALAAGTWVAREEARGGERAR